MKLVAQLIFAFLLTIQAAGAQKISFSKSSDKYFTQAEYAELLKTSTFRVANDRDFPESIFAPKYEEFEEEIIQSSTPFITKKFKWVEDGYSTNPKPGTSAFEKRKELYKKEFYRGVRDAINSDSELRKKLFSIDESDRILSFQSKIKILTDGTIRVKESIQIYNGDGRQNPYSESPTEVNNQIQRGIVRDFPTKYFTPMKFSSKVGFQLITIKKNGEPEPYSTEKLNNGIRFYIGQSHIYLDRGVYLYEIEYETDRQLILNPDKDEFYWNVTGNGWAFVIEKASCEIEFPEGCTLKEWRCYTGAFGDASTACSAVQLSKNQILFKTTNRLFEYQGLTVATAVEKGIFASPGAFLSVFYFLSDNLVIPGLFVAILLLFLINLWGWFRVGRDPKPGVIIPQFEPPAKMSPADVGYLYAQKFDGHLFAAALVDMAVKKKMIIEVKKGGLFSRNSYEFKRPLRYIYDENSIFMDWYDFEPVDLFDETATKGVYNTKIAKCYNGLKSKLEDRILVRSGRVNSFKGLFSLNDGYVGLGIFFLFFLALGTVIYLTFDYSPATIAYSIIMIAIGIVIQIVFVKLMRAYTGEGRKILDHVLGFKKYLETTEEKVFEALSPPDKTLELYEKHLPYAIALECENKWAQKFKTVIDKAVESGYSPDYYRGLSSHSNFRSFGSDVSSGFSSTVSSASTPPSSSSGGSSGGGFSGGGGGGGGGGGW